MWPAICLIIPEYTYSYLRTESSYSPHNVSSDINHVSWCRIICIEGLAPGRQKLRQLAGQAPGARGRFLPPVCCVCTAPHAKFLPHYPHCLGCRPRQHKGGFEAAPTDPASGPRSPLFCLTGKHVSFPPAPCLSTYGSTLRSHDTLFGLSLTRVYTDVYLPRACTCTGGSSSGQLTPGMPTGKSPGVTDITIWSDPSLMEPVETFPWTSATAVH